MPVSLAVRKGAAARITRGSGMVPAFAVNHRPLVIRAPKPNVAQETLNAMAAGAGHALHQAGRLGDAMVEGAVRATPHLGEAAGRLAHGVAHGMEAAGPYLGHAAGRVAQAAATGAEALASVAHHAAPHIGHAAGATANLLAEAAHLGAHLTEAQHHIVGRALEHVLGSSRELPLNEEQPPPAHLPMLAGPRRAASPPPALVAPQAIPALMDAQPHPYAANLETLDRWEELHPRGSLSSWRSRQRIAKQLNDSGTATAMLGHKINTASHEAMEAGFRALDALRHH